MSRRITPNDVRHVARLARLSLSEAELAALADELAAILGAFESLARVDVTGIAATVHAVGFEDVALRPDVVERGLARREALAEAPAAREHAFAVPKVLGS